VDKLEKLCISGEEVDIHALFTQLTLDIIGRVAFGTSFHAQDGHDSEILQVFSHTPGECESPYNNY
jgi:hypothetical protein